jgi:hypothetical protein
VIRKKMVVMRRKWLKKAKGIKGMKGMEKDGKWKKRQWESRRTRAG